MPRREHGQSDGLPSEAHLDAPWYRSGTLPTDAAHDIEALSGEDEAFARLMKELDEETTASREANEEVGALSPHVFARLQETLDAEQTAAKKAMPSFLDSLRQQWSGLVEGFTAPSWKAVGAAALVVCTIQTAIIARSVVSVGPSSGGYETASGPKETAADDARFMIEFAATTSVKTVGDLLADADAKILDGPFSDGSYRIRIRGSGADRDKAVSLLQRSVAVVRILPQ